MLREAYPARNSFSEVLDSLARANREDDARLGAGADVYVGHAAV
jgi:hypothetical protein